MLSSPKSVAPILGALVCLVASSCVAQQPAAPGASDLLGMLSSLGPQVEKTQSSFSVLSKMFSSGPSATGGLSQPPTAAASFLPQGLGDLGSLLRSTQERSMKTATDVQTAGQQMAQQTADQAANTQKGIQAALVEIGQGLQKIAINNPSLLPDVKNLYQSVSMKLSPASSASASSDIVPARNADQLLDNLAKVATKPTQ